MRRALAISTLLILASTGALASNFTVKAGGGGNFTTISACAASAVAGDTCTVFAGTYSGWSQPVSGVSGNLITFIVNGSDVVTLTSGVSLSNRSYVRVSGFRFSSGGFSGLSVKHCQMDHNTFQDATAVDFNDVGGTSSTDNVVTFNTLNYTPNTTNKTIGIRIHGDRTLVEHNTINNGAGDCTEMGGTNIVLRFNICQHKNGRADFWGSNVEHIDLSQGVGGVNPPFAYTLFEGNIVRDCTNDQGNCHYIFMRGGGGFVQDSIIERYNFGDGVSNLAGIGDSSDGTGSAPSAHIYHNTAAEGGLSTSVGTCMILQANTGGVAALINNICHNMVVNTSPTFFAGGTVNARGNIAYDTTCTTGCTWGTPYTSEPTYPALHNQNPLFANLPNDGTLQAGSPARNAGSALTTVTSGCGTTSLVVGDPKFFQPGWGPNDNPIAGDMIRVGASSTARVTGINYGSNTLTLNSAISCSAGASVYLYTDTAGTILFPIGQTNPDIGAFPFSTGAPPPVTLTPSSLSFAAQGVGTSSVPQSSTLTNTGTTTLTIASLLASGDYSRTTTCGATLSAGASCSISVTFTPTATGTRTGAITVTSNASTSPDVISLTGIGAAPGVSFLPTSLSFGNVNVGATTSPSAITLTNSGSSALTISSSSLTGTNASDFSQSNTCPVSPATLAAAASCTFSVTFHPAATGGKSASLTVTDNASGSPHSVPLSGTGVGVPIPALSPSSLTFGSQTVGTTSASQAVTLTNTGTAVLTITTIATSGDFGQTNGCGSSLAPAAQCTINVTFTPTATGTRSGTLSVTDNASGSPHSITLTGTGTAATAPIATITPASLTFTSQTVGTTSASQNFTLQNTGTATLNITSVVTTGDYSRTTTCGATLGISASCTVSVSFTPTATGTRTGTVVFTDNAAGSPQSRSVTGTGTAPTAPIATITPSSLSFGNQNVGTTSAQQTVTLQNTGTATLNITSVLISPSGPFARVTSCGATLAVGASCTTTVTFSPVAAGAASSSLIYTDNASGSPQSIPLSGTGIGVPNIQFSPTSLTFSGINVGTTSAPQTVTLSNIGSGPLLITSIAAGGDFFQSNNCGSSVAAAGTCTITVTFSPSAAGTRSGNITVQDNATGSPHTVSLTGTGLQAAVTLTPASLTFGAQNVGTTSSGQVATLTNSGTATLNITSIAFLGTNASNFSRITTCGATLAASASCTITVSFTPSATGTRTATLSVADSGLGSPHQVSLTGTGTAPAVTLTTSLAFGNQANGTISTAQTATLQNSGTGTLTITSISFTGTDPTQFTQTSTCGATLAASASCAISVRFAPTSTGAKSASLSVASNATGSPHTSTLTGTGTTAAPIASVSPTFLSFAARLIGTTSTAQAISVTNIGTSALHISSVTFTGTNAADYSRTLSNCTTVAINAVCTINVSFTPSGIGPRTAVLNIADDGSAGPTNNVPVGYFGMHWNFNATPYADNGWEVYSPNRRLWDAQVRWDQIETSAGVYSWTNLDARISDAQANGAEIMFTAAMTPAFYSSNPTDATCGYATGACWAPSDVSSGDTKWKNFITAVINHVGTGKIKTWECWNEPDNGNTWHDTLPHLKTMCTDLYTTVHALDPGAQVDGSPAYTGPDTFDIQNLLANGWGAISDINSFHSYACIPEDVVTQTNAVKTAYANAGLGGREFWNTEGSWTASCGADTANHPGRVARYLLLYWSQGIKRYYYYSWDNTVASRALGTNPNTVNAVGTAYQQVHGWMAGATMTQSCSAVGTVWTCGLTKSGITALAVWDTAGSSSYTAANEYATYKDVAGNTTSISSHTVPISPSPVLLVSASATDHLIAVTGVGIAPSVSFSPSSVSFGSVNVGVTTPNTTITVTNNGTATLQNLVISLTGTNPGDFAFTNAGGNRCRSTLNAGASCRVLVRVSPTTTGARSANLHFVDSATSSPQDVALSVTGTATAPLVTLNPTSLTFGSQQVSTSSATQTIVLSNSGTASLTITSIVASGDYSRSTTCGGTLGAGLSCNIVVTFTPTTTGTRTGAITVTDSATGSPHVASLTGTGTPAPAPTVSLSATSLTFSSQQTGTTSSSQSVTLTNLGDGTLILTSISLTGTNSGDYARTTTCGATVAPSASCTISVTFSPTAAGTRTASVSIADNASNTPQSISLSGTAFVGTPGAVLSPALLTFAPQNLLTSSASQTVTLTNNGNATLLVSSVAASGDFSESDSCGGSVAAGTSCALHIVFTPTVVGARTGTLTVNDNAPSTPQTVSLSGTGTGSSGSVSPTTLTFTSQVVGTSSISQAVTLTNTGNISMSVSSVTFAGSNPTDFSRTTNCVGNLAAAASCTTNVTFTPTSTGARTATLTFTDSGDNSPQTVAITGTGAAGFPLVQLSPTSLNFGSIVQGSSTASQMVTLTNTGTATLNIASISFTGTNTGDFSKTTTCGATVAASATCTVSVTFTPTANGARSANLSIADDATGSPHIVPLSGTGLPAPAPAVILSAASLTFGSTQVGTSAATQSVTITNSGDATLNISGITIAGVNATDYSRTTTCGATLAAAATCGITVTFTPLAAGTRTAAVSVADDASDSPQSVALNGTAFVGTPTASILVSSIVFAPTVVLTTSTPQLITLTNTGTANLLITSVVTTSDFAPSTNEFAQSSTCSASLAPNASCTVTVTFTPQAAGTRTGATTFTDNASTSPQVVLLAGTGLPAPPPPGDLVAVVLGGHVTVGGHLVIGLQGSGTPLGPPTYTGSCTSTQTIQLPTIPPFVGLTGANTQVGDPEPLQTTPCLHNAILRVTDASTNPAQPNLSYNVGTGGSADENKINLDSTLFDIEDDGTFNYPYTLDPVTLSISRMYTGSFPATNGIRLPGGAGVFFSYVSPKLAYQTVGVNLRQWDFSSCVHLPNCAGDTPPAASTVVKNFSTDSSCNVTVGMANRSYAGHDASDTLFGFAFSTGGQNTATTVTVWDRNRGCITLNTATGTVAGAWGATGAVAMPCTVNTIHNVKMSKSGNWMAITPASGTCGSLPVLWQIGTTTVLRSAVAGSNTGSGHFTSAGYTHYVNNCGFTPFSAWATQMCIRPFVTPATVTGLMTTGSSTVFDNHLSWNNVDPGDTFPFLVTETAPFSTFTSMWQGEIIGVSPVNGTVWRFGHHYSSFSDTQFDARNAIGVVSPDGRFFIYGSNMQGQLGSGTGGSTCTLGSGNCREDVFIVRLQ